MESLSLIEIMRVHNILYCSFKVINHKMKLLKNAITNRIFSSFFGRVMKAFGNKSHENVSERK